MLHFQRQLSRRYRFDTTGEPLLVVPKYDDWLEHYYTFETDGSDSVNSLDLTLVSGVGGAMIDTGIAYGDGLVYDGTTYNQTAYADNAVFTENGSIMWAGWFAPDVSGIVGSGHSVLAGLNGKCGVGAYADATGFRVELYNSGSWVTATRSGLFANGTTVHIAALFDDAESRMMLAVNGVLVANETGTMADGTDTMYINQMLVAPAAWNADGNADELAIWKDFDPVLTPTDFARLAAALYNYGDGVFYDTGEWVEVA